MRKLLDGVTYHQTYYASHREEILKYAKQYRLKHLEEIKVKRKTVYLTHPKVWEEYRRKYRETHKEFISKNRLVWQRKWKSKLKAKVLSHYSGKDIPQCANLYGQHEKAYTDLRALSLDHINGLGLQDREKVSSGTGFYSMLYRNNFPRGFQVLCMNCQFIKRVENNELMVGRRHR